MKVVCNSGPLIALGKLESLSLVHKLYSKVYITPSVFKETVEDGLACGAEDAKLINTFCQQGIIHAVPLNLNELAPLILPKQIAKAEIETIQLALRLSATIVLIDDSDARQVAETNFTSIPNIQVKGTLGVLVESYQKNLLTASKLEELLSKIIHRRDIWISSKLCHTLISALHQGKLK